MKKYELRTLDKYPRLFIGRKVFFQLPKNELNGIRDFTPNKLYTIASWEGGLVFVILDDVKFPIWITIQPQVKSAHLNDRASFQLHHSKKDE